MGIENNFKILRKITRQNSKAVTNHINSVYISRNPKAKNVNQFLCMFCGTDQNLTKEHVIPKWLIDASTKKKFTTNINGLSQTYNKTTIPTCANCNNNILGSVEAYVKTLITGMDLNQSYPDEEYLTNIIRWLEIIDYKFQVLNVKRRFLSSKDSGFIRYLSDFPLSVLRQEIDYSPYKVISEIRKSAKRMTVMKKSNKLNSLLLIKTTNKDFHFFHSMDNFIFLELAKYGIAIFYFFKKEFLTHSDAQIEAKRIVEENY